MLDVNIKDIGDLRDFAAYLMNLGNSMSEEFDRARATMIAVNEGWNDTENRIFMDEFEQSVILINQISEHMQRYSQFITRKCDIIEEYKNTRM